MPPGEPQFEKSLPAAEKTEQAREIEFEEIASLYEPAKKILGDMRENIEAGQYVAILGDDASGRLPTLLFRKVLSAIYEEKKIDPPKTLFFAGRAILGQGEKEQVQQDFVNFLEKTGVKKMAEGKRFLFITDTIASGAHLHSFAEALQKMGINFDILTIGTYIGDPNTISEKEKYLGGKIFWGKPYEPKIYKRRDLSAVEKDSHTHLFARRIPFEKEEKKKWWRIWPEDKEVIRERKVNRALNRRRFVAREDIEILAQKLLNWYREEGRK